MCVIFLGAHAPSYQRGLLRSHAIAPEGPSSIARGVSPENRESEPSRPGWGRRDNASNHHDAWEACDREDETLRRGRRMTPPTKRFALG